MPNTSRLALPYPISSDTADVPRDVQALADRIEALTAWIRAQDMAQGVGVFVTGDLKLSAAAPPSGADPKPWLECDGSAVSRTTYGALFAAIGTAYGAGDNSTTFNLPDYRGRSPLGQGQGDPIGGVAMTARTRGAKVGEEVHKLLIGELADHDHLVPDHQPYSTGSRNYGAGSGGPTLYDGTQVINAPSIGVTLPFSPTSPPSVNQAHNNTGAATVCVVLVKT